MESVTERKSVLHELWTDRIARILSTVRGAFGESGSLGHESSRGRETRHGATDGGTVERREKGETPPAPILTPEERILEIVSANGGGTRQAEIVSAVEWSESTVSRKLQALESAGDVTRYQIGREKVVYLSGQEPAAVRSPFAEEPGREIPLAH